MKMRAALIAVPLLLLSGCGGSDTSQANNGQANIANNATPETAKTNGMAMLAVAAPSKERALQIMHDRHEAMEKLGDSMKTLHRALDASPADLSAIRVQTALMARTAAQIPGMFPVGTGPDVGKTRAKPEIWAQQNNFHGKSREFLAATLAIDAAARAGDLNKVMALHERVDQACKACHDPFRAPKN